MRRILGALGARLQRGLLGAVLTCAAIGPCAALASDVPPSWNELENGRIVIHEVTNERGTRGLRCYFLASGSADALFDKLKDIEFFKASYSNIERLTVLRSYEDGADLEFVLNAVIAKVHYVVSRRYDRASFVVFWTKLSGDLQDITGSWRVQPGPLPGSCLVTYESFVDPGFSASGIYTFFAKRQAESNLAKLRDLLQR